MLFSYRYMWIFSDSQVVNFAIFTGDEQAHKDYIDSLSHLAGVVKLGREYVNEFDPAKIGIFETLFDCSAENVEKKEEK